MKKQTVLKMLVLAVVCALMLTSVACDWLVSLQEDPEITDEPSSQKPEDKEAAERAKAFAERFDGTWNAMDGTFVDFGFDEAEPFILFGNWSSEEEFATNKLTDAVETAEDEYDLSFVRKGRTKATKYHVKVDNNALLITDTEDNTVRYEYSVRQYPPEINKLTKGQIIENLGGVRTEIKEHKLFVDIFVDETNEEIIWLATGEWKDGGGYENYTVRYRIVKVEADEEWNELTFTFADDNGDIVKCPGAFYSAMTLVGLDLGDEGGMKTYEEDSYDNHKEVTEAQLADRRAKEFGFRVYGAWTSSSDLFIDFDFENGELWFMAAVWNSGGEFPSGHIIDAIEEAPNDYRLTVIMRGETEPVTMHCLIKGDQIKFRDQNGEQETLWFDNNRQYPTNTHVVRDKSLMTSISSLRTEITEKKEYLYFHMDDNDQLRLDIGEWGKTELKASYRVPCGKEVWELHLNYILILVDDDYNVTKVSGSTYSIDDLLVIDFGGGEKTYYIDAFGNH